jgi:hypothetical protein
MTSLTVFELAQLEAEEAVWVPTRATRFISRLLGPKFRNVTSASTMERHRHKRQPKPSAVRMITELRASRRRYASNDSPIPVKTARIRRISRNRRTYAAGAKLPDSKQ